MGARRYGALILAHHQTSYFERVADARFRVFARAASMEINESWAEIVAQRKVKDAHLRQEDLFLLRCARDGLSSREIGAHLGIRADAVDGRFQRLNGRLARTSRSDSARYAIELGLI